MIRTGAGHDDFLSDLRSLTNAVAIGGRVPTATDPEREYLGTPAPNAIRWCIDKQYLNSPSIVVNYDKYGRELPGYVRGYQIIRDTFQLRCPICNRGRGDCWGKTRDQLEEEILLEWSKTEDMDVCPKCKTTRKEFELDGLLRRINVMHLACGQRSGKSVTVGMIGTYVEHFMIAVGLSHPGGLRGYFGLVLDDPFEMTFLASNETQGKDTIWAKYRAFRRESPWLQRAAAWFNHQAKEQITPPGMERWTYAESNSKIINEFPTLNYICNSLNSNASGQRGRTRIFGGIDEISHMQTGDSRMSQDEVYRAIEHSMGTVRSHALMMERPGWLGLVASATSPKSRDDKGMKLLEEAEGVRSMLAYHYSSFEFNPFLRREDFKDQEARDPVGFERDFLARPPAAAHPLIMDWPRFLTMAVDPTLEASARFSTPKWSLDKGDSKQYYIGLRLDEAILRYNENARYVAFDAGLNFDAFAGACAHGEVMIDENTGVQRVVTVFDWIIRILPPPGTEVYFDDVFATIRDVSTKQHIAAVEFDHWNAKQLIQQMRRLKNIRSEEVSIKGDDYRRFRADVYSGLVRMLPPDPRDYGIPEGAHQDAGPTWLKDPPFMQAQSCALYELEFLEEDPDTQKVFNPRKGERRGWNSNDVAEVVVHAHKMVQEAGYTKKHDERSRAAARKRSEGDAISYVAGGGGKVFRPHVAQSWASPGGRSWRQGGGRGW